MYEKVLVGVDDSPGADDAVRLAKELVSDTGAVILAHVHHGYPLYGRPWDHRFIRDAESRANELLSTVGTRTGVTQMIATGASQAGRGLHELAERLDADLLVVGSTRNGGVGRVLLGDGTREATNGAPCSIAVAPIGYGEREHHFREIGVAYNGTSESRHALGIARILASRFDATLSAFEAVDLPASVYYGMAMPYGEIAEQWIAQARSQLSSLTDVEPHVAYGDPAEELTLYSASVDLLVVGARDFGPLGRLVHSSLSTRLSRTARCPLLLLTRAVRDAREPSENVGPRVSQATETSPPASVV